MWYERNRCSHERKRCFTNDEGRPLEVGVQAQTSNHRKSRKGTGSLFWLP